MKYVSIDIETTGLNPNTNQIVEFAAVIDDLDVTHPKPVELLPCLRVLLHRDIMLIDAYCAMLHRDLWQEMSDRKGEKQKHHDGIVSKCFNYEFQQNLIIGHEHFLGNVFRQFLETHGIYEKDKPTKITAAGKNFASFDLQFLNKIPEFQKYVDIRHRVIDVAPFYWRPGDDKLPDTNTCLSRAKTEATTDHTALNDARNVVKLVREVMWKPFHL